MRCPKCGFNTFDHAETCKRCNTDLRPFQPQRPTTFAKPPASPPPATAPRTFDPNYQPPNPSAPSPPTPLLTLPASPAGAPPFPPTAEAAGEIKSLEKLKLENQLKGGASWFYWIAVLSMINTVIILIFGGSWNFIVGLGITRFIDAIANELAKGLGNLTKIVAFVLDLFIAGIFVAFGYFAAKRKNWSFIVGMILYMFDGLLFLLVMDFLSIAFHALVLFFMFRGLQANRKLA